ncbi:Conserved_hypothetical protein [Hexamita inflata]|uniref:Uncharacterized protein n=1 Tax=Hexamita inflata TaxID=28002 RepID=A0AA86NZZ2_9EUKA|nr:Conserved hypothetical protein [Hexamita inflata]
MFNISSNTFLINKYQIKDHLISYESNKVSILDQTLKVIDETTLIVDQSQLPTDYQNSSIDQIQYLGEGFAHFNRVIECADKLYTLIEDILYEVYFNQVIAKAVIPNKIGPGHSRICKYKNQILVTNGREFYLWNEQLTEFQQKLFYYQGNPIQPKSCCLYDFNNHVTARIDWNRQMHLFELRDDNCELLHTGTKFGVIFSASGFQVYTYDLPGRIVIDFTQEKLKVIKTAQDVFLNYQSLQISKNSWIEYNSDIMNILLPDYIDFCTRRQLIDNSGNYTQQKQYSEIEHLFYPVINPNQYFLQNSYQLQDKIIFYHLNSAYVTDLNRQVQAKVPIRFLFKQKGQDNPLQSISPLDKLWFCSGSVYSLLGDTVFQVSLFTFKEIARVPGLNTGGYCRICVYESSILVTNEKQFYQLIDNKLVEKVFCIDNTPIETPIECGLFSYGDVAVVQLVYKKISKIIKLGENCEMIYEGNCSAQIPMCGLWPFSTTNNQTLIVDLTNITHKLIPKTLNQRQLVFVNDHIEIENVTQLSDETYVQRRDAQYNKIRSDLQFTNYTGMNKFFRDVGINKKFNDVVDIFGLSSNELNELSQFSETIFAYNTQQSD